LERGEGAALHAHLFEELLDWSEPQRKRRSHAMCHAALTPHSISLVMAIPDDIETRPRGEGSQERSAQEQRELTALGASYLVQPIPDSPAELSPSSVPSQEQVDVNVVHMLAGAEIDALSLPPAMTTASLAGASVSELVGQLAEGANLVVPDALPAPAFDPVVLAQLANSIPQEQLQQLAQMFAAQQQQPEPPQPGSDQNSWDSQAQAFSADAAIAGDASREPWPSTPEEPRWGGFGRGRGRGRPLDGVRQFKSRIPCSFYAQGRQAHIPMPLPVPLLSEMKELMEIVSKHRCKYGDQCNFSHDQGLS
jgi:protein phosphatase 1 regulatory subunit 10